MAHDLEQTFELLSRTPVALDGLLRGLPSALTTSNEGDDTWTAYDVVGHLAYGDRTDWPARARMILSCRGDPDFSALRPSGPETREPGKVARRPSGDVCSASFGESGRVSCSATDSGGPGAQGSAPRLRPGHAFPAP